MTRPLSRISVLASLSAILVLGALLHYFFLAELPTSQWRPGELIQERYSLHLPRDLPSGNYTLALGWYTTPALERLSPDSGAVLEGDRFLLAQLSFPDGIRRPP
jgi:hypothetical protein